VDKKNAERRMAAETEFGMTVFDVRVRLMRNVNGRMPEQQLSQRNKFVFGRL